ncbi:MAG: hypothetical protein CML04_02040 [Pseudozobellia sp.]|nr:hypothetical protein [Pseudozobellia sp.]MBG48963.1 hypothetical protein [Pseudozobellia sp.]|tara:strand:- start:2192 stop:2428 length:237 start_codon:yes stop_codon:yes gene_type:complete
MAMVDVWAAPNVPGTTDWWGHWYTTGGIITRNGNTTNVTLNFNNISSAPAPVTAEIIYFNGTENVTIYNVISGSGSIH